MSARFTFYSRAIARHSAALVEARTCKRLGMESAAQAWMVIVRGWAALARTSSPPKTWKPL